MQGITILNSTNTEVDKTLNLPQYIKFGFIAIKSLWENVIIGKFKKPVFWVHLYSKEETLVPIFDQQLLKLLQLWISADLNIVQLHLNFIW